jgi:hypothetical protein
MARAHGSAGFTWTAQDTEELLANIASATTLADLARHRNRAESAARLGDFSRAFLKKFLDTIDARRAEILPRVLEESEKFLNDTRLVAETDEVRVFHRIVEPAP